MKVEDAMARASTLLGTLVAAAASSVCANDMPSPAPEAAPLVAHHGGQVGGIVTDQTITPAGQDFYRIFATLWHDMPLNERFSIAIRERPSASLGNWILIDYRNRTIFQAVLPPARGNIRAVGERAVDVAYESISAAEAERLLFRDDDLAGDEF
jgi:curli production assembly/transport component CsgE